MRRPARPPWTRWRVTLAEAEDGQPLCLSLANTRHWRNSAAPGETLHAYADLARWAVAKHVAEDDALAEEAMTHPAAAQLELRRAIALREAIAGVFAARVHGRAVPDADLNEVTASFNEASRHLRLALGEGALVPELAGPFELLAVPRWQTALSAIGLLGSPALARVKQCADDRGCGWLFLDGTRNGSRQFCFSAECANRTRQVRFRARHRAGSQP